MYYEDPDPTFWQYYVVLFVVSTIVMCVLLNTMMNLAERVSRDLRTLSPAQIWVSVIPVFGSFWIFYVVNQLSGMLREEFARRKIVEFETSPGLSSGLGFCFTLFVAHLSLSLDAIVLSVIMYVASIALLAVYWTKLVNFTKKIDQDNQLQYQSQYQSPQQPQWQSEQQFYPPQQQYSPPPQQFPPPPNPYEPPSQWQPPPQGPPPDEWEKWRPK